MRNLIRSVFHSLISKSMCAPSERPVEPHEAVVIDCGGQNTITIKDAGPRILTSHEQQPRIPRFLTKSDDNSLSLNSSAALRSVVLYSLQSILHSVYTALSERAGDATL